MNFILKNYFYYLIFFYTVILIFLSLKVGITHDESYHHAVWLINKKIYLNYLKEIDFLLNNFVNKYINEFNENFLKELDVFLHFELGANYDISFSDYGTNFYGIGFQILSIPVSFIINLIISNIEAISEINILISKHPTIILMFIISGIYLKKIINLITNHKFFSEICAILFLSYPYILGHSFFNTLDVPFMSVWLICTYYIIKISSTFLITKKIFIKDVIYLGLLTGFLLSIRISGVLIFFEYLIFLIFTVSNSNITIYNFIKITYQKIILFLVFLSLLFIILHPNYWNDFAKIYYAILYMGQHIQTVCTVTLGTCMKAQNLPSTYIPIWLFFKLPILILFGLVTFPIVEKKIFLDKKNGVIIGSLIASCFLIILSLIFFNVNLYDEIRQILFVIPIIFIISLSFLFFFSKKISFLLISLFIIFFSIQNIKIFPYNYIWLNNFSSFTKVNNVFEADYWGVSTRNISNYINSKNIKSNECVISSRNEAIKIFTKKDLCFVNFKELHKKNLRPFYVVLIERTLKKGIPNNCSEVHTEYIKMNFTNEKIDLAKVYKCN